MLNLQRIGLGLVLSIVIGYLAYRRRSLSRSGWLGAVITGTLTFGLGGWAWGLVLVAFFVSSSILSHYKEQLKAQRVGERFAKGGQRDLMQTLANGGIGALLAAAYALAGEPPALMAAFLGVMATVTADTWATELGVLSPHEPRLVTTGRVVPPGTSGGVTPLGTAAAGIGGLFIGWAMLIFSSIEGAATGQPAAVASWMPWAGLLGGLFGALADSLLGATVQALYLTPDDTSTERTAAPDGTPYPHVRGWRWMNNDLVNLLASLVGGAVALAVFVVATALAAG